LIEVLFIFWLAFIIKFPQWNPFRGFTGLGPSIIRQPKHRGCGSVVAERQKKISKKYRVVEPARF